MLWFDCCCHCYLLFDCCCHCHDYLLFDILGSRSVLYGRRFASHLHAVLLVYTVAGSTAMPLGSKLNVCARGLLFVGFRHVAFELDTMLVVWCCFGIQGSSVIVHII